MDEFLRDLYERAPGLRKDLRKVRSVENPHPHPMLSGMKYLNYNNPFDGVYAYVRTADPTKSAIFRNEAFLPRGSARNRFIPLHEAEHAWELRSAFPEEYKDDSKLPERMPDPTLIFARYNRMKDFLGKDRTHRFLDQIYDNLPYLREKYPLLNEIAYTHEEDAPYFRRGGYRYQMQELMPTLSAVELYYGVDLTRDPVLRKSLFKDPDVRKAYNSLVGYRSTRWDKNDLPPMTILD